MKWEHLVKEALQAQQQAYVPYSHFWVGAALESADGAIFTGCNIENSSFGATNCAERTAFFNAVSQGVRTFRAIAIVGGLEGNIEGFCAPCGICRQVMTEFCDPATFLVILAKSPQEYQEYLLKDLLPLVNQPQESKKGFQGDSFINQ